MVLGRSPSTPGTRRSPGAHGHGAAALPRDSVNATDPRGAFAGIVAVVMLRRQSWKSQSLHFPSVSLSPGTSRLGRQEENVPRHGQMAQGLARWMRRLRGI